MPSEIKKAYVVLINTDRTEGRGFERPTFFCNLKSTARRLAHKQGVQGTSANFEEVELFRFKNSWYGPIVIEPSTKEEEKEEEKIKRKEAIFEKAKSLGLTESEILELQK